MKRAWIAMMVGVSVCAAVAACGKQESRPAAAPAPSLAMPGKVDHGTDPLVSMAGATPQVARAIKAAKDHGYADNGTSVAPIGSMCKGGHCATMYLLVFSMATQTAPKQYGAVLATAMVDDTNAANTLVRIVGLR